MKNKIFIATIGKGDKEDGGKSLMNQLINECKDYSSEFYGFYTEGTKEQTKYLKEKLKSKNIKNSFKKLKNPDDTINCYEEMIKVFIKYKKYKIYVNPTSGTKIMTFALGLTALDFPNVVKINFIGGDRKDGRVIAGTEKKYEVNLKIIGERKKYSLAKNYASMYLFQSSLNILDEIKENNSKDFLEKVNPNFNMFHNAVKLAYDLNNFKIEEIFNNCNKEFFKNKYLPSDYLKEFEGKYKAYINKPTKNHVINYLKYLLNEIYLNAERHAFLEEYDNASARIYRGLEVYSQMMMCELDLMNIEEFKNNNRFSIKKDKLKEICAKNVNDEDIKRILEKASKNEIKTSLYDNLLIGSKFDKITSEELLLIKNSTKVRNNSILAHGFKNITKDEYDKFRDILYKKLDIKLIKKGKIIFKFKV